MHQYLDSDSSGTSENGVSSNLGDELLEAATQCLNANKKNDILGETAGRANDQCIPAPKGPWWGDYMFSMEPTTGTAYKKVLPQIKQFIGA